MDNLCLICDGICEFDSVAQKVTLVSRGIDKIVELSRLRNDEVAARVGDREYVYVHEVCRNSYTKRLKSGRVESADNDEPKTKVSNFETFHIRIEFVTCFKN
jgi:hypothetical protein